MHVIGVDAALVNTGVAQIRDGRAGWRSTITVEGELIGERYAVLRRAFERLATRAVKKNDPPAVVVVEQPELGIRPGRDVAAILKLYGAFAVLYTECVRLWPRAHVMGVLPDSVEKKLRASIMRAKYRVDFKNSHEADALYLADYAWDVAVAKARAKARENDI